MTTNNRRWAALIIAVALAILTAATTTNAAGCRFSRGRLKNLPANVVPDVLRHMARDAAQGPAPRIGTVRDNIARLASPANGTGRQVLGAEWAFARWLGYQPCFASSANRMWSALECARKCNVLFFGWSNEHMRQLQTVLHSPWLVSEYPMVVSVGPDGWSLRHHRARDDWPAPCVVNPAPPLETLMQWPRRRLQRLTRLAPRNLVVEPPVHLARLRLDLVGWPADALHRPLGQRLSDGQLAYLVAQLLASPAVWQLSLAWTPAVVHLGYPAVLGAMSMALASPKSNVTHLQIDETNCAATVYGGFELLPTLLVHAPLGPWAGVRRLAVKWKPPPTASAAELRRRAFEALLNRLPGLRGYHLELAGLPLAPLDLVILPYHLERGSISRSIYGHGVFVGVMPGRTVGGLETHAAMLMLPWRGADGAPNFNLALLGAKTLRETSDLTLYAVPPWTFAPLQRDTPFLAVASAPVLERLAVESGQAGAFCNQIVQLLPPVLPASTRRLVLRTFILSETADADDAQRRLEILLQGNPALSSITVGLHLPCSGRAAALQHLDRVAAALASRIGPTAVQIELSTCRSRTRLLADYSKRVRAIVPRAVVRRRPSNVLDIATRLHSGSLLYP